MKILSWNVNGLRAAQRKGFLDWFSEVEPDIFCAQEIKATPDQLDEKLRFIDGYYSYFNPAEKKGYSGVAIYTKIKPKSVDYGIGIKRFDSEGRILIADYGSFILFNIYFPNGRRSKERLMYKMEFYEAFLKYVDELHRKGRNIIVTGDFNTAHKETDLARPKPNEGTSGFLPMEREWMDKFISKGFVDTFRIFDQSAGNYTYWDQISRARERNVGWRIDYFFVNDRAQNRVISASICDQIMGSDHCPIQLEVNEVH